MPTIYLKQPEDQIVYETELCCENSDERRFKTYYNVILRVPKSNIAYEEEVAVCLKT